MSDLEKLVPKKSRNLWQRYKLTREDFLKTLTDQQGLCRICGVHFSKKTKPLVDHCHTHGHIRGLLCHKCNTGLGLYGDSVPLLQQAINYLIQDSMNED